MRRTQWICLTVGVMLLGGCATTSNDHSMQFGSKLRQMVARSTAPMADSMRRITSQKPSSSTPLRWDWATAIPRDTPRSETLLPVIGGSSIAAIAPSFQQARPVQLVSTSVPSAAFELTRVGKTKIKNLLQMHIAVQELLESENSDVQLEAIPAGGSREKPGIAFEVTPNQLIALSQQVAAGEPVMRIFEDGNPWVLIREGNVRAKLMARVERERGVVHLLISFANCGGGDCSLPAELRAQADGQALRCLSVAETLESLYGSGKIAADESGSAASFAAVSERNDYLIPTNFKRLAETTAASDRSRVNPALPAFATVPGAVYPGPAVLGDARALSNFMFQQQISASGEPEKTGWIIFDGKSLREGGVLEITVDLGQGNRTLRFDVPAP